jgi:hypothetical protein
MVSGEAIKAFLGLEQHPEGGFFVETYRADEDIPASALPERYLGRRAFGTCIYYLLTPETFSAIHRLASDEIFHFYLGDPVEMLQLWPDGSGKLVTLGPNILNGEQPQVVVPRGVWQGSRLLPGGRFALLGCTVAPGFTYGDYEPAERETLMASYPEFNELIVGLTR